MAEAQPKTPYSVQFPEDMYWLGALFMVASIGGLIAEFAVPWSLDLKSNLLLGGAFISGVLIWSVTWMRADYRTLIETALKVVTFWLIAGMVIMTIFFGTIYALIYYDPQWLP